MATTIELKNSVTTGNSPSSLAQGETGWNITDKKVWIGNASSTPIQLIGAGASMTLTSLTTSSDSTIHGLTVGLGGGSLSHNTVVGAGALGSSNAADYNAAFGYNALTANTSGTQNNVFGYAALANTTGSFNSVFGTNSLLVNTTGGYNSAFGVSSLASNTTASNNNAFGYYALNANTTGTANCAFGTQSLASNTTASNNTAVGYQAGYYITTGANNSILGSYNGNQGGLDIRTASNYIVLSDGAGNPRLVIDNAGDLQLGQTSGSSRFNLTTASGGSAITITDGTASGLAWQMGPRVGTGTLTDFGFYNASGSVFLGRFTSSGVWYQGNNSTLWSITSDQRLKKNIVTNTDGLNKISAIQVRNFEYKLPSELDSSINPKSAVNVSGVQIGVIAQELQTILPDCVETGENGILSVNSSNIIWHMINAIQELSAEVNALKAKLGA